MRTLCFHLAGPVLGAALVAACGGSTSPVTGASGAPSSSGTSTNPPDDTSQPPAGACSDGATDIEVSSQDLNGFPPYAVSECSLVYVNASGALVLRDLATKKESTIAPSTERPRRPALSKDVVTWEADIGSARVVRTYLRNGGEPVAQTVTGAFAMAGEPRVSGRTIVFTAWPTVDERSDSDVWTRDVTTGETRMVVGGAAQQRFADISETAIAVTDFSEDPDGTYNGAGDLADIVVYDRKTQAITRRPANGKQAFPMLGDGDLLAYLEWVEIHPEPKLVSYGLSVGPAFGQHAEDQSIAQVTYMSSEYARPAVNGKTIEWVANPDGKTTLFRAPLDRSSPPVKVSGLDDLRLFAPAPAKGFTVLATAQMTSSSLTPRLRGIVR